MQKVFNYSFEEREKILFDFVNAAKNNDLAALTQLVNKVPDIDYPFADNEENFKTREDLLNASYEKNALYWAAFNNNLAMVKLLLKKGACTDISDRNTPLILALMHKNIDVANLLLDYKALTTAVNDEGQDTLYLASLLGDLPLIARIKHTKKIPSTTIPSSGLETILETFIAYDLQQRYKNR